MNDLELMRILKGKRLEVLRNKCKTCKYHTMEYLRTDIYKLGKKYDLCKSYNTHLEHVIGILTDKRGIFVLDNLCSYYKLKKEKVNKCH